MMRFLISGGALLKVISLAAIFCACSGPEAKVFKEIDFEPSNLLDSSKFEVRVLKLEAHKEGMIHSIAQVEIWQDYIFVLDNLQSRKLLVFNMDGEFVCQVGVTGRGPGEYVHPWSFSFDEQSNCLAVLDRAQDKVVFYELSSFGYVKELQLPFSATKFLFLEDGKIAWFGSQTDSYIIITDGDGVVVREHLPRIYNPGVIKGSGINNMFYADGEVLFHTPFSSDLFSVVSDSTYCKYGVNLGKNQIVSEAELKGLSETNRDYLALVTAGRKAHSISYYNTDSQIYCSFVVDGALCIGIYDKETDEAYYYLKDHFIDLLALPIFYNPVGTYDEWLVSVINNMDVLDKLESQMSFNDQIEFVLRAIDEDSGFHLLLLRCL